MKKIQLPISANQFVRKFSSRKIIPSGSANVIVAAVVVGLLSNACRKEAIAPSEIRNNDSTHFTQIPVYTTGVKPDDPTLIGKIGYYKMDVALKTALATSVDLSAKMPSVRSQGSQSSCVGWAVGYYCKTYQENVEKGWNTNENIYSPSWIYNQINGGKDEGTTVGEAMALLVDRGCDFRDNFPYSASDHTTQPDAGSKTNAAHYKSSSWKYLEKSVSDFKTLLASSRVFVISIPVHDDFREMNAGNQIYDDWSGERSGNHAICVVGYDDSRQAFKFVNSWGTDWGLRGYGWIAYERISSINNAYLLLDKGNTYDTKYLLGDFNGDKVQDIFTGNGDAWYVSYSGVSGLKRINTATTPTVNLKIGDFNNDLISDVFYASGSEWKVSYSGTGKWTTINTASEATSSLKIGDFNGDGLSDVFHANGSEWRVSYSGSQKWATLNTASEKTSSVELGDFNGDKISDVFYANGSEWKVSYSGNKKYAVINTASEATNSLRLGDFNGDKITDIFNANGLEFRVSYSGNQRWTKINTASESTAGLELGDLNGDRVSDVLHAQASSVRASFSGTSKWRSL